MHPHKISLIISTSFVAFCLMLSLAQAQNYHPPGFPATPEQQHQGRMQDRGEHERMGERGEHERGWDGGERERREHEWQEHQRRYFGGIIIDVDPFDNERGYRDQLLARCNVVWQSCVTTCNAYPDPSYHAACIANCNNDLYECQTLP